MKTLITFIWLLSLQSAWAFDIPQIKFEYSYGLDMNCPLGIKPEKLNEWQLALIPKIPEYRLELLSKLAWFQSEWEIQGTPLLKAAINEVGRPFPMNELQTALFLCPRFPSMGTPLSLNIISYLNSSAADMPPLVGKPIPVLFFVSTAFHEVLHKYIHSILEKQPSEILRQLPNETEMYKAHLHLYALHKQSFESLNLSHLLSYIKEHEATHGPDYLRAWDSVYNDKDLYKRLLEELK